MNDKQCELLQLTARLAIRICLSSKIDLGSADICNLHELALAGLGYDDNCPQVTIDAITSHVRSQLGDKFLPIDTKSSCIGTCNRLEDTDITALIAAFKQRGVNACFVECEEDGLSNSFIITPDKDSDDCFWIYPSYATTCSTLERCRIPEMVQLINTASNECVSRDIEEAVIIMSNSDERPCGCGLFTPSDKFHYPSSHNI